MRLPEVPLPAGALFVGDLHLDPAGDAGTAAFLAWLEGASGAPALVVLGDLFEYWVGPALLGQARPVVEALRGAVERGTAVHLVPGNRDFLLDARFERATGARLHPHGFVGLAPGGARVLVVHGDELCTLDRPYQRLRRVLRSAPMRAVAPRLPGAVSTFAARRLRAASKRAVSRKPSPAMEQQEAECRELLARHACTALVCGHAHRFRDERLDGGGRWLVVDAFGGERDTLEVGADGALALRAARDG